jgi:hypothetical protein
VATAVRGGLILDLGVNGLLPWALIETDVANVKPLQEYVASGLIETCICPAVPSGKATARAGR